MMERLYTSPAFKDRDSYAMSCGIMRSLEKRLLDDDRLGELLEAEHAGGVFSRLTHWGWISAEGEERELPPDARVEESLRRSDRQLLVLAGESTGTALLLMRYELQNLAAALKAGAHRADLPALHPRGLSPPHVLEEMAARKRFAGYPGFLASRLEARLAISSGSDMETGNAVFVSWHDALIDATRKERSELLTDFLQHRIDLENIMARVRALRRPRLWEKTVLLPGGILEGDRIAASGSIRDLGEYLERTVYGHLFGRCFGGKRQTGLRRFIREADDFLTAVIQPAKYVTLGPEPLWGYYHARQIDACNIRAVLLAVSPGRRRGAAVPALRRPYV